MEGGGERSKGTTKGLQREYKKQDDFVEASRVGNVLYGD